MTGQMNVPFKLVFADGRVVRGELPLDASGKAPGWLEIGKPLSAFGAFAAGDKRSHRLIRDKRAAELVYVEPHE